MSRAFVGIDPGVTGAVVVLEDGELEFHDTPVVSAGKKKVMDSARCAALLRDIRQQSGAGLMVIIEKVGSMPGEGVSSARSFGFGCGIWEGILAALEIPYQYVTPQRWQKEMLAGEPRPEKGQKRDKSVSRTVARRLWPLQTEEALSRVKDHGRAEAALMAEWGRRIMSGGSIR